MISDWNMEPMTGYDLLKEVRADPNLATTPFIMITAESKTENVIAAKKAGVNNYIVETVQRRHAEDQDRGGVPGHGDGVSAFTPSALISQHARACPGHTCAVIRLQMAAAEPQPRPYGDTRRPSLLRPLPASPPQLPHQSAAADGRTVP